MHRIDFLIAAVLIAGAVITNHGGAAFAASKTVVASIQGVLISR